MTNNAYKLLRKVASSDRAPYVPGALNWEDLNGPVHPASIAEEKDPVEKERKRNVLKKYYSDVARYHSEEVAPWEESWGWLSGFHHTTPTDVYNYWKNKANEWAPKVKRGIEWGKQQLNRLK